MFIIFRERGISKIFNQPNNQSGIKLKSHVALLRERQALCLLYLVVLLLLLNRLWLTSPRLDLPFVLSFETCEYIINVFEHLYQYRKPLRLRVIRIFKHPFHQLNFQVPSALQGLKIDNSIVLKLI